MLWIHVVEHSDWTVRRHVLENKQACVSMNKTGIWGIDLPWCLCQCDYTEPRSLLVSAADYTLQVWISSSSTKTENFKHGFSTTCPGGMTFAVIWESIWNWPGFSRSNLSLIDGLLYVVRMGSKGNIGVSCTAQEYVWNKWSGCQPAGWWRSLLWAPCCSWVIQRPGPSLGPDEDVIRDPGSHAFVSA